MTFDSSHINADSLIDASRKMRLDCLTMGLTAGNEGIHIGGAFSCVEILAALYLITMKCSDKDQTRPYEDRLILSKGHAAPALYAALHQVGLVADEELSTFKQTGSFLTGHPSRDVGRGIDFSSGSLGQGLSLGVGVALAAKLKQETFRTFVIIGDGECDEGSIWEAAMAAAHFKLDNIIAVIDANVLQYDGETEDVMDLGDLSSKWRSFGWDVEEINGHDFNEIIPALERRSSTPRVVIAHTCKGKGVSFSEGVRSWHHARLTDALYAQAVDELSAE